MMDRELRNLLEVEAFKALESRRPAAGAAVHGRGVCGEAGDVRALGGESTGARARSGESGDWPKSMRGGFPRPVFWHFLRPNLESWTTTRGLPTNLSGRAEAIPQ
jgi:hypothetical protein